jgi:hypothetical protein
VLPLRDENPVRTTPVVTWFIVAACVAAYLFWQPGPFDSTTADVEFNLRHAAIPCEVVDGEPLSVDEVVATFRLGDQQACGVGDPASPPLEPGKNVWLAMVVSMFLHGSLLHIAGNLLFLWVFGNNIEDRLGLSRVVPERAGAHGRDLLPHHDRGGPGQVAAGLLVGAPVLHQPQRRRRLGGARGRFRLRRGGRPRTARAGPAASGRPGRRSLRRLVPATPTAARRLRGALLSDARQADPR